MTLSARLTLAQGRDLLREGKAEEAASILTGCEAPPGSASAKALFQGIAAYRTNDLDAALQHFARSIEAAPDNRLAGNWRAIVRARRGDLTEAVEDLLRVGLVPYTEVLVELGLIYENHLLCHPERRPPTGLGSDALRAMATGDISAMKAARHLTPRAFELAYARCDFQALLRHAAKALQCKPNDAEGRLVLVHCMAESGLFQEALEISTAVCKEQPLNPIAQSQRGWVAVRAGDVREALQALAQVEIEGPEDFNCHWNLGLAALRAGDESEARWFFTKAMRDYFIGSFEDSWARLWWAITSEHFRKSAG